MSIISPHLPTAHEDGTNGMDKKRGILTNTSEIQFWRGQLKAGSSEPWHGLQGGGIGGLLLNNNNNNNNFTVQNIFLHYDYVVNLYSMTMWCTPPQQQQQHLQIFICSL